MPFTNPIIAGNILIREAIQSPNFSVDPDGAVSGWQIAKDGSATFYDVTIGGSTYTIDSDGNASFETVNANTDLILAGESLLAKLDLLPRGLVAVGNSAFTNVTNAQWTSNSVTINSTTSQPIAKFSVGPLYADRYYRVTLSFQFLTSDAASIYRGVIRYTVDGTQATASSGIMDGSSRYIGGSTTAHGEVFSVIYSPAVDYDVVNMLLTINRQAGAGSANVEFDDPNTMMMWTVEDIGNQTEALAGGSLSQQAKFSGAAVDPDPTSTYIKTYSANWSRAWNDSGNDIYSTNGTMKQGFYSGFGNGRSWIGFPFSTIQSDLVGATVKKVEVYLYYSHWHFNSGGTASIGFHTSTATSAPSYNGALDNLDEVDYPNWGRNVGKWVTITSEGAFTASGWKTGAHTGITISAPSNNQIYYGKADGNSQSHEPKLRITYEK